MEEQWAAGLARRMISGDRDAFDELMKQFYPGLLRAAYLIAGNRADSEDIVQETFAACWAGRMRIRDPEHIGNWLQDHDQRSMADGQTGQERAARGGSVFRGYALWVLGSG